MIDCSKYFAEKYIDMLNETEVRLYTDAFVAANADFCRFRWLEYYVDQGVEEDEFDLYYQGNGSFDWDAYNNRTIADVVLTYKEFFIQENSNLNITSEEYDLFNNGLNFDWTGFWESREPPVEEGAEEQSEDSGAPDVDFIDINDLPRPDDIDTSNYDEQVLDFYEYIESTESGTLIYEYDENADGVFSLGFYDYDEAQRLVDELESVLVEPETIQVAFDHEAAAQLERVRITPNMTNLTDGYIDWGLIADLLIQNADIDFDGQVTTPELTDALLWEFEINANLREFEFVNKSLSDVCTWYQDIGEAGLFKETLQACLEEHGWKIWNSFVDWEAERLGSYAP